MNGKRRGKSTYVDIGGDAQLYNNVAIQGDLHPTNSIKVTGNGTMKIISNEV